MATNKATVDLTTTTNNTEIGRNESTSTSDRTSNLIKKFSIFDEKQAKTVLETVVEVLDLNVDSVDEEEGREHRHEHKIDLNKLENLSISESASGNCENSTNPLEKFHCITCDLKLLSRNDQIEHYKGDLHLFNLKQKMKGKPVVSAEEFERLTDISSISGSDDDSDEEKTAGGGLVQSSSSSESDEEVDDEKTKNKQAKSVVGGRNKTKIMFKLTDSSILVLLKCILFPKHELLTSSKEIINRLKSVNSEEKWCIILVAAGHFAAAVFKGDQPILHKTFHRYVVRAKRGTVQSQHDSAGRNARSAGANIRRHQEAAFKDDIRLLIGTEWKSELEKCKCIFIRVPKYNRPVLIASNKQQTNAATTTAPFVRNDPRLRHIPFMTFRPTFNEVKRTHTILSKLENYNSSYLEFINKFNATKSPSNKESTIASPPSSTAAAKSLSKTAKSALKASNRAEKEESSEESENEAENDNEEEVEEADNDKDEEKKEVTEEAPKASDFIKSLSGESLKLFNEIYTCCATNNPTRLKQIFDDRVHLNADSSVEAEQQSLLIEALLNKRLNADLGFTLLHLTSQLGFPECISLLLHNGANPAISDLTKQKRLPYFLCLNKATRDTYRRFMSDFPNRYDYEAAKISSPLTTEKLEKDKEKKRAQRKQKRKRDAEKQKTADKVQKQQEAEEAEKKLFLSLSDQQKRQLIAGRNFFNAVPLNADSPEKPVGIKVISRCWYCAKDMSTHVPFEYFDYKFCSTKCLNSHRQSQGSKT